MTVAVSKVNTLLTLRGTSKRASRAPSASDNYLKSSVMKQSEQQKRLPCVGRGRSSNSGTKKNTVVEDVVVAPVPTAASATKQNKKKAATRQSLVETVVATPIPTAAYAKKKDSQVDGNLIRTVDNDADFGTPGDDHADHDADKRKVGGKPKKKSSGTFDDVSIVDPNIVRDKILREIEERDMTETGYGGDSDKEGLEIDFHNNSVRQRVKLGIPNNDLDDSSMGETDTDNLDTEYIDNSVGEPWWHMRAPGAAIPGLPKGWSPPREPDNWGGCGLKIIQVHP
jgi:hypothetical protein